MTPPPEGRVSNAGVAVLMYIAPGVDGLLLAEGCGLRQGRRRRRRLAGLGAAPMPSACCRRASPAVATAAGSPRRMATSPSRGPRGVQSRWRLAPSVKVLSACSSVSSARRWRGRCAPPSWRWGRPAGRAGRRRPRWSCCQAGWRCVLGAAARAASAQPRAAPPGRRPARKRRSWSSITLWLIFSSWKSATACCTPLRLAALRCMSQHDGRTSSARWLRPRPGLRRGPARHAEDAAGRQRLLNRRRRGGGGAAPRESRSCPRRRRRSAADQSGGAAAAAGAARPWASSRRSP